MSDRSSLSELASFVGQSALASDDAMTRLEAVNAIVYGSGPRLQRRGVGDMLAAVLALSSRTRRMLMPMASIEIDVFTPSGARAVDIALPARD